MLRVENICKTYKGGFFGNHVVDAVKEVSFEIPKGQTLGIAGSSGCGKSTIANMVLRLINCDSGRIFIGGEEITHLSGAKMLPYRKRIQMVFQHPESSLDPSKKIVRSLMEPMEFHHLYTKEERMEKIRGLLKTVGVGVHLLDRYPYQLSGGELQRLVICRALTLDPEILILDEPTSMLDVSVQAHIMNILRDLQRERGLTYLFISHDIEVLGWLSHELAIMKNGVIIEMGAADEVLANPGEDYTKELLKAFKNWGKT